MPVLYIGRMVFKGECHCPKFPMLPALPDINFTGLDRHNYYSAKYIRFETAN